MIWLPKLVCMEICTYYIATFAWLVLVLPIFPSIPYEPTKINNKRSNEYRNYFDCSCTFTWRCPFFFVVFVGSVTNFTRSIVHQILMFFPSIVIATVRQCHSKHVKLKQIFDEKTRKNALNTLNKSSFENAINVEFVNVYYKQFIHRTCGEKRSRHKLISDKCLCRWK